MVFIALLFLVHQDFWWWDDSSVVFGFLPIGLASQMFITLAAGVGWWLATRFCWPKELEDSVSTADAAERSKPDPRDGDDA